MTNTFLDLGHAPPSNAYLSAADLSQPETHFPLKLRVCDQCWLVQTEDYNAADELFSDEYAYFSSVSSTWLDHAAKYSSYVIDRFKLASDCFVIEVASNDGYLLKNFVSAKIPCLGIEPTASTASAAEKLGVPVLREFFGLELGKKLAAEGRQADLIAGNNVYAHVPDINDFTGGLKAALKPKGVITLEFPHLYQLLCHTQFDTVYHEHYSYLSLYSVSQIFESQGLRVFDVQELKTHGGSLRVFGCHAEDPRTPSENVEKIIQIESDAGMRGLDVYQKFQERADGVKNGLLSFLLEQKAAGRSVVAYGAAAKGNTLLNYAGVRSDLLPAVVDAAPSKQGLFLPGSHIPIYSPEYLSTQVPDNILILPWNLADEIVHQFSELSRNGALFWTAVPEVTKRT